MISKNYGANDFAFKIYYRVGFDIFLSMRSFAVRTIETQ